MGDYQALAASETALRDELRSVKAQVGPATCHACAHVSDITESLPFKQYALTMIQAQGGRCSACIALSEPAHVLKNRAPTN